MRTHSVSNINYVNIRIPSHGAPQKLSRRSNLILLIMYANTHIVSNIIYRNIRIPIYEAHQKLSRHSFGCIV